MSISIFRKTAGFAKLESALESHDLAKCACAHSGHRSCVCAIVWRSYTHEREASWVWLRQTSFKGRLSLPISKNEVCNSRAHLYGPGFQLRGPCSVIFSYPFAKNASK